MSSLSFDEKELECPICLEVPDYDKASVGKCCGQIVCSDCAAQLDKCPACRDASYGGFQITRSKFAGKLIAKLPWQCGGCDAKLTMSDKRTHNEKCPNRLVQCKFCMNRPGVGPKDLENRPKQPPTQEATQETKGNGQDGDSASQESKRKKKKKRRRGKKNNNNNNNNNNHNNNSNNNNNHNNNSNNNNNNNNNNDNGCGESNNGGFFTEPEKKSAPQFIDEPLNQRLMTVEQLKKHLRTYHIEQMMEAATMKPYALDESDPRGVIVNSAGRFARMGRIPKFYCNAENKCEFSAEGGCCDGTCSQNACNCVACHELDLRFHKLPLNKDFLINYKGFPSSRVRQDGSLGMWYHCARCQATERGCGPCQVLTHESLRSLKSLVRRLPKKTYKNWLRRSEEELESSSEEESSEYSDESGVELFMIGGD